MFEENIKKMDKIDKTDKTEKIEKCVDCHFFCKYFMAQKGDEKLETVLSANNYDRTNTKREDFDWQIKNFENKKYKARCYFSLWDEERDNLTVNKKNKALTSVNRKDVCFFIAYNSNLGLPTMNMQKEPVIDSEKKECGLKMILGLFGIILLLIVDVIYRILNF